MPSVTAGPFLPLGHTVAQKGVPDTARMLPRRGVPRAAGQVAAAICFLASGEASTVNGAALPVDGGLPALLKGY